MIPFSDQSPRPKHSQKQYKTKLHLWGLTNKYITGSEYEELIRKGKRHEYYVRNRRVTHRAIVRYQYRKDKRDKAKAAKSLSDSANPPVPTSGDASICGYDSGFDRGNGFEGASNDLGWGHYMTLPLTVGDEHFFDNDGYNYMLAHDTLAASTTEEYTAEHCTYDASGNFIDDIHMGENRHIHQGSSNL